MSCSKLRSATSIIVYSKHSNTDSDVPLIGIVVKVTNDSIAYLHKSLLNISNVQLTKIVVL